MRAFARGSSSRPSRAFRRSMPSRMFCSVRSVRPRIVRMRFDVVIVAAGHRVTRDESVHDRFLNGFDRRLE